jgi:hypothetical protein
MSAVVTPHLPTATPATAPAPSATPGPASPSEAEFSALLGGMNPSASSGRGKSQVAEALDQVPDAPPLPPASTLGALQSLDATLSGMAPLGVGHAAANSNAAPASGAATAKAYSESSTILESPTILSSSKSAAPLSSALATAAGEFAGGQSADAASNAGALTPLRTQLQSDPSLGLRDFQMKTFLAAAGALPARSGAAALHAESSWSPIGATPAGPQSEAPFASQRARAGAQIAEQFAVADQSAAAPATSSIAATTTSAAPAAASGLIATSLPSAPTLRVATNATAGFASPSASPTAANAPAAASLASASAPPPISGDRDAATPVRAAPPVSTFAFSPSGEVVPAPRVAASGAIARETAPSFAPSSPSAANDFVASATTGGSAAPAERPAGAGKAASPHRTIASSTRAPTDAPTSSAQSTVSAASNAGGRAASRGGETTSLTTSAAVAATSRSAADATSASTFTVAFADLPNFIVDQAGSLSAAAPDAAPATNAAGNSSPKAAEAVKELQISLDPADLGAMTLKLRLAGGKLSVTISVANPQTLAAIKDDSALIAQRLGSNNQALDDLVIQQQNLASTTESAGAHAFANDSSAKDQPSDAEPQARRRPNAMSRGASDSRGGSRDLTV